MVARAEATEQLWQWILEQWHDTDWCLDVDGLCLQDKAIELGLLREEPYNPAVHGEHDMAPGDPICVPVIREDQSCASRVESRMRRDPKAEIVRCMHCGALTVLMGRMAQCPRGCPGWFDHVGDCRVPEEGVRRALCTKAGGEDG